MASTTDFVLLALAGWMNRHQADAIAYLREENRVLREQLGPRRLLFTDGQRRRLALRGQSLGRRLLGETATLVTPDTILRWYRSLVARKYDGSGKRPHAGRSASSRELAALVIRIANENPRFGYTRIRDTLLHLGHEISRSTVQRILREHGIEPAPERDRRGMPWRTFLRARWGAIAAADFFMSEVLTAFGLIRYHVFFVMDLQSRRVEIAGIAADPDGSWMVQVARNLTDAVDGFLLGTRHLILDRDPIFTAAFRQVLASGGVKVVRLPARSPNLNAFAERFVLSIKSECLAHLVPLSEAHLRNAIHEYVSHYHAERPHQGLGETFVVPPSAASQHDGPVTCTERLGGLRRHYHRRAA